MLAFTFAWVVRRPETVPVLSIALVFLLSDMLFQRPPGLWSALIVIGAEWLRSRARGLRDQTFFAEWFAVAVVIVAVTLANRVVLALTVSDLAPLGLVLIQMMMTIVIYPAVVLVSHTVFRIRHPRAGETNGLGA